ncbi:Kae1-associated serine/threonine protein kinase [Candidatus Micrarchaeota archaeon]|nr:Kae1-associated serine/threonine protein kinase [Candidatus Micrarchaeota archaeon]
MRKIAQGAEAVLFESEGGVVKHRLAKGYRLKELDLLLRKRRTRREARILRKLQGIVRVPRVLEETGDKIVLEKINGVPLKDCLERSGCSELCDDFLEIIASNCLQQPRTDWEFSERLCRETGELVGKMHSAQIVHGDLTTSNFLVSPDGVVAIDFGLSYVSHKQEDFATDLHVFEEIVPEKCFTAFSEGYKKTNPKAKEVFTRLEKLHRRGRYKKKERVSKE